MNINHEMLIGTAFFLFIGVGGTGLLIELEGPPFLIRVVLLAALACPLATFWLIQRRAPKPYQCPQCRYDLRGVESEQRCPECGMAYPLGH